MRSLATKFTISKAAGTGKSLDISIGSLYFLLKEYTARNSDDFDGSNVLIGMPIAINRRETWFYTICMDGTRGTYVYGNDGKNLIFSTADLNGHRKTSMMSALELEQLLIRMPARGRPFIRIGNEFETDIYVMSMFCDNSDLSYMPIIPLDAKLTDLRQWPRDAISLWARYHLKLSSEQLVSLDEFDQRWKMINYAQEVFTYRCAEYNPIAMKKMKAKRKKPDKDATLLEALTQADYIIDIGHSALFDLGNNNAVLNYTFISPSSGRVHEIRIERGSLFGTDELELRAYVGGHRHNVSIGDNILTPNDLCILQSNDYFLHISLAPIGEGGDRIEPSLYDLAIPAERGVDRRDEIEPFRELTLDLSPPMKYNLQYNIYDPEEPVAFEMRREERKHELMDKRKVKAADRLANRNHYFQIPLDAQAKIDLREKMEQAAIRRVQAVEKKMMMDMDEKKLEPIPFDARHEGPISKELAKYMKDNQPEPIAEIEPVPDEEQVDG